MDAEHMLSEARESLGSFCINECKAYCCRKGYLVLDSKEAVLVSGHALSVRDEALKDVGDGTFSLHLGATHEGCPSLEGVNCKIHKNPLRPHTCKDFPIFVHGKKVTFSHRCLAVRAGKMYAVEHELLELGFEIDE